MALELEPRTSPFWSKLGFRLAFLGAASGLGCSGLGSEPEPVQKVPGAIVGGQIDIDHDSVFGILVDIGRDAATCTSTLIAPNLLLTARHCVSPIPSEEVLCGSAALGTPFPAENVFASNAVNMRQATRWYQGSSIHVPTEGNDTCGYDVALVVLEENVSSLTATPAIPRIDREVEAGEPYVAVGYGLDDSGQVGERMARDDLQVDCAPGTCGFGIRVSEFGGEAGICQGDSGGPAFDADGKVVGVVSRGATPCDAPVYGTVTAWKDLIMEVALQAAERGGYTAPFWAVSGASDPPPPPVNLTVGVGEVCARPSDCDEGLACFRASSGLEATCAARCAKTSDCVDGLECRSVDSGAANLCLAKELGGDGPRSSCSLAGVPARGGWLGVTLGALALVLFGRRKRRRFGSPDLTG